MNIGDPDVLFLFSGSMRELVRFFSFDGSVRKGSALNSIGPVVYLDI
jgi:hypothetical protein